MLDFETSLARLAIALAIGLLIGLERGWSSREEKEGGQATFQNQAFFVPGVVLRTGL